MLYISIRDIYDYFISSYKRTLALIRYKYWPKYAHHGQTVNYNMQQYCHQCLTTVLCALHDCVALRNLATDAKTSERVRKTAADLLHVLEPEPPKPGSRLRYTVSTLIGTRKHAKIQTSV